jgi:hypothetical protein
MSHRIRLLLVAGSAALAIVGGIPVAAQATGPAATDSAVTGPGSAHSPIISKATSARAKSYWTKQRMINAIPVPVHKVTKATAPRVSGPQGRAGKVSPTAPARAARGFAKLADPGAAAASWAGPDTSAPATTSGKVFFVGSDGLNYVCSGSTVNSGGKNVVFTAGHCVARFGQWFNSQPWIYVPGYSNGNAPHGQWTARQLWTRVAWLNDDNRAEDIGAAVMNTNASGQRIVDVVGGQGIEWNYPLEQYQFQFGYPAGSPFDGEVLKYCTGNSFNDGGFNGISCNMTEGASGGAWIDDFDGNFGWLDGVNSWVFWDASGIRFKWNSPYFGDNAADLYNNVANL